MAHKKAGGTAHNLRDSNPKYLGIKLSQGEKAHPGSIIVRQRGTKIIPGKNIGVGKDHTLFALKNGTVSFREVRKINFNGKTVRRNEVSIM